MSNRLFSRVKSLVKPRSNFDLSRTNQMSVRMGNLYPSLVEPALPGDTFRCSHNMLCRFAPMTSPVMHNIDIKTFYFNVPMRLIYSDWEEFITGGVTGDETPVFPRIQFVPFGNSYKISFPKWFAERFLFNGSLADYLGFPTISKTADNVTATSTGYDIVMQEWYLDLTPFLGYQLIWNEYFRDQNLEEEFDPMLLPEVNGNSHLVILSSGNITAQLSTDSVIGTTSANRLSNFLYELGTLRVKAWDKNYFTSALPEPQRGEAVEIPFSGTASVKYVKVGDVNGEGEVRTASDFGVMRNVLDGNVHSTAETLKVIDGGGIVGASTISSMEYDPNDTLKVDIQGGNADITELRRSLKLQEFLEAMSRGGSRYIEQMKTMFGVRSSDARLQRPEFLGSTKQPVIISEVLQTSESATTPQGTMTGRGVSASSNKAFSYFHEEHSLVFGLVVVMPAYDMYNGLPRKYQKFDRFDYYWHQFDHIGEQVIKRIELLNPLRRSGSVVGDFGYSPRYAEYKSSLNEVHGEFKESLDFWHMAQEYSDVALNASFMKPSESLLNRPFAVQTSDVEQIYLEMYFNFVAKRMMSRFSTPKID